MMALLQKIRVNYPMIKIIMYRRFEALVFSTDSWLFGLYYQWQLVLYLANSYPLQALLYRKDNLLEFLFRLVFPQSMFF